MRQREALDASVARQASFEANPENRIVVDAALSDPHPAVRDTAASLRERIPDDKGMVSPTTAGTLAVRCAPATIDRAMRIMNALIRAGERRGWTLLKSNEPKSVTRFQIGTEVVGLSLEEKQKKIRHIATAEEIAAKRSDRRLLIPLHDRVPAGRLVLEIADGGAGARQRSWADSSVQRLETVLNDVALEIFAAAEYGRIERLERERSRERGMQWLRLRQDRERRIEKLDRDVDAWEKALRIRDFLDAFEEAKKLKGETDDTTRDWIAWARGYADEIDPLR
jgi:hypothetical protein